MANAKAKLYHTTTKYLDSLPVTNGNIIFVSDINTVCLDINDKRVMYNGVTVYPLDIDRINEKNPINKTYSYVIETNVLWGYFNDAWVQITQGNKQPVIFGDSTKDFPTQGDEQTLYAGNRAIFKWDNTHSSYRLIANRNDWEEV